MIAGRMRIKLELMRPVYATDRMGATYATDYETTAVAWAERVKYTGRRSDEIGEHFTDYRAEFNIRDAHEVHENWRVHQLGGLTFTVVAVEPYTDKGMTRLICERVNE